MKLRIIKPEGDYAVGDILEPDMPDVARLLIARGIAEELPAVRTDFPPPNKALKREKVKTK